jgi:hypothetical protein
LMFRSSLIDETITSSEGTFEEPIIQFDQKKVIKSGGA